jgi:hypothetical protein
MSARQPVPARDFREGSPAKRPSGRTLSIFLFQGTYDERQLAGDVGETPSKILSADDAAALVLHGANVGMSGFTGSGYPKAVPLALAHRIEEAHTRGEPFRIGV